MHAIFRLDDGTIACHPISYWMIFSDGKEADVYLVDDDPLEFRDGEWKFAGDLVEILEISPDIRRFM